MFRKKLRNARKTIEKSDFFDGLPDDIVISILSKLSTSASSPSDFINVLITCKRLNSLTLQPIVLCRAGPRALAIRAKNWSESAHRFLKLCVNAGNIEACYTLGMIRFYCLQNRGSGASLMAKAAMRSHAPALFSLAVIQFNGSGASKNDKDLRAGVALCARAAFLGYIDALRELGHCLQDGYGVKKDITEGRRLLFRANARELASAIRSSNLRSYLNLTGSHINYPVLGDFGCTVPGLDVHPSNCFLKEWFESSLELLSQGLRLCGHKGCGRPETRPHEFRRCSVCGTVNYCSRACQALDWKLRHKTQCRPMERWLGEEGVGNLVEAEDGDNLDNINFIFG